MSGFEDNLFDFCDDDTPSSGYVSKPLSRSADRGSKRSLDQDEPEEEIPNVTIKGVLQQISEKSDGPVLPSPPKRTKLSDDLKIDTRLYKSRISVVRVDCPTGCSHEVVCPPDAEYKPLEPIATPAREYKFKLDPFQQRAVQCIDNLQSVLVSAHTSAGKTVVAEYAIALGLKKNQRVIYTTPIKALSNQKYREFSDDFADVGLMTGDVTINPNASCLIMTTEILRSMLYRGSEILREVGWVVFDEIHYMRNKERGYVWEETIILLQDEIRMVFLSATVPNARQFAEWVVNLHMQPVHVVYTEYRPVPLQHYVYPTGGNGIHLVVDETGTFREGNFNRAMASLQTQGDDDADSSGKRFRRARSDVQSIMRLIRMVMEHDLAPVIVFSFAKRECEQYASECNGLDFNTPKEKELVTEVFNNAIDVLSEEDKNLPQVKNIMPMLVRGIGIHHGGLLPILKETIEILFGEGLIKALFATETFAMGLNMPARTVVFTSARKFDGKEQRWLHGAEYIQMSGRAGRRGKDDKGVVIFMVDEKMSPSIGRNLLQGNPEQLTSAFQLTYNMVLNLLRVDGINPEFMLQRSFHQFQSYANVPVLLKEIEDSQTEYDGINLDNEEEFAAYHKIRKVLDDLRTQYQGHITVPKYMGPFLQVGRLIHVKVDGQDYGWAAVVSYRKIERKKHNRKREQALVEEDDYELHVLMRRAKDAHPVAPATPGVPSSNDIVEISLVHIVEVSAVRMKLPKELTTVDSKAEVMKKIDEAKRRFSGSPPLIDPWKDMKIEEEGFKTVVTKMKLFKDRKENHPLNGTPDVEEKYELFLRKVKARERALKAKDELKSAQELLQMEELKKKTKVLKALNYCSASGVLDLKGRVACELSSADELMLAEMLFEGIFQKLPPSECMAVLSCLVCDENSKAKDAGRVSNSLSGPLKQMQEIARRLAKVFRDHGLTVEPEEYVGRFKPHLMDVVFEWCKGATFGRLLKMTDIFEGSIIRCMRRLEETTRQCIQAARGIGNKELEEKFHEGIKLIKRDIVFAASLYL